MRNFARWTVGCELAHAAPVGAVPNWIHGGDDDLGAESAWEEAHTRRSNVDLIAAVLDKNAAEGDLIVVKSAWDGVAFNRYYHGRAHWVTVPPIDSHKVHRNDLYGKIESAGSDGSGAA